MLPNSIIKEIFLSNVRQAADPQNMYNLGEISFELQQDLTNAFEDEAGKIKYYGRAANLMGELEVRQGSAVEVVLHGKNSIELTTELFTEADDDAVDAYAMFHFDDDGQLFKIEANV
jgi:hypothetical protein